MFQGDNFKKPNGKFLANVQPEDLDEQGRFICKEPVLIIGAGAFKNVRDKLTYAKIDGVISIENEAFVDCEKLQKVDIGFELDYPYLENYDGHMFWKDKTIDTEEDFYFYVFQFEKKFGQYDVHIKNDAFKNCTSLKEFHFPSRVVVHGSPFCNCNNLTEVTFDGTFRLQFDRELLDTLYGDEMPLRAITFKDCNNVQKMTFGREFDVDIYSITQFENLKEINVVGNFCERRNFWKKAISIYPLFYLILPTCLYNDKSFAKSCLYSVLEQFKSAYGFPSYKIKFLKLLQDKEKIEGEKSKIRAKNSKIKSCKIGDGIRAREK